MKLSFIKYGIIGLINILVVGLMVSTFFLDTDFGAPALAFCFCFFFLVIYNLSIIMIMSMIRIEKSDDEDNGFSRKLEMIYTLFSLWPILLIIGVMLIY